MAVIWDMDGVISDTQKIHSRVESVLCAEHGVTISPEQLERRFAGVSLRDILSTVFGEAGLQAPDTESFSVRKYERMFDYASDIREISGTREVIEELRRRNVPLAVASGSRLEYIEFVLSQLRLAQHFDAIASSQEVEHGKPAPDVFLLAAKRLNIEPGRCIVVEDGINGMIAARAANMICVALVQDLRPSYPAVIAVKDLREIPINWLCR